MASRSGDKLPDLYELLGVTSNATSKELRKAYRKKALKLHPDKNPDNPAAAELFDKVTKAYDLLCDEDKKKEYDSKLAVQREREAKWEAANAEIRAMKEKLEQKEKAADLRRFAKRQKTEEDRTKRRNKDLISEMMEEIAREDQAKDALRSSRVPPSKPKPRDPASPVAMVKIKWGKGESHSQSSISSLFEKYGEILDITLKSKTRTAKIEFRKLSSAEDALIGEASNPTFKIKLVRLNNVEQDQELSTGTGAGKKRKSPDPFHNSSSSSNPYAFGAASSFSSAKATASESNPYSFERRGDSGARNNPYAFAHDYGGNKSKTKTSAKTSSKKLEDYQDDVLSRMLGGK